MPGFDSALAHCLPLTPLEHLVLLRISGSDAGVFLNAQFCNDVNAILTGGAQLNAWCNPKGRVFANFILSCHKDAFWLLLPVVLVEDFVSRLQMFRLRSKVIIADPGTHGWQAAGMEMDDTEAMARSVAALADEGWPCFAVPADACRGIIVMQADQLREHALRQNAQHWRDRDLRLGLPWLDRYGSERFLPQNLNLDWLDGMSFDKGCYPGQEIVARLHYRGTVKQRLMLAETGSVPVLPELSAVVIRRRDADHVVGQVLAVGRSACGRMRLQVVVEPPANDDEMGYFLACQDGRSLVALDSLSLPHYAKSAS